MVELGVENLWGVTKNGFNKMKAYVAMISLQFGYAGMFIITLVSFRKGFSHWIFVVYRHAVATIVIAPFAYFLEKKVRPQMTKSLFFKITVLGFLEPVLDQNLYSVGIQYTSATFASAMTNVLPAVTFIMAVIFRLEKVNLKKIASLAKVVGTLITVSGAMLMTLYKGPVLDIFWFSHGDSHHSTTATAAVSDQHWIAGTIMFLGCIVGWSTFFILQNMILKEYPAELSLTTLVCLTGTVQGAVVAAVFERRKSAWAIGFDSSLLAATYSGIVCSGLAYYLQGVVNKVQGPVFVTAFSPLIMIITAVLGAAVLSEQLHLGSLIGAVIIVCGLYSVVWGKCKEKNKNNDGKSQDLPVVDKNAHEDKDACAAPAETKLTTESTDKSYKLNNSALLMEP